MKTNKPIIIFIILTLTACGGKNRGLKSDAVATTDQVVANQTPAPAKGVVYFENDGTIRSATLNESEVVFPDSGKIFFQNNGTTRKFKVYDSETYKNETFVSHEITFIPAPSSITLIPAESSPETPSDESDFKSLGNFTFQKSKGDFLFKINQNQIGKLTVIQNKVKTEYNDDGTSSSTHFKEEIPLKNPLVVKPSQDNHSVQLGVKMDPSESEDLFTKTSEEAESPTNTGHSYCTLFHLSELKDPQYGTTLLPERDIRCDTNAGTCGPIISVLFPNGRYIPINTLDHDSTATCKTHSKPAPSTRVENSYYKFSFPKAQKALQLIPADASPTANIELLSQDISIDQ